MNRGPAKESRPVVSFAEKAAAAWGDVPDWLSELCRLADQAGLAGAGKRVGYAPSAISTVISRKYQGDYGRVEEMVRGALMAETVNCPVQGEMGRDRCLEWQRKPFAATSSQRVRMFRACKTCINRRQ